jgi:hypothetical protein
LATAFLLFTVGENGSSIISNKNPWYIWFLFGSNSTLLVSCTTLSKYGVNGVKFLVSSVEFGSSVAPLHFNKYTSIAFNKDIIWLKIELT